MAEDRDSGLPGNLLCQGGALADFGRRGLAAQMGVVHQARAGEAGDGLNGAEVGGGALCVPHLWPVGVEDEDQLVILLYDLGLKPGQHPGAHRIAADIQDAPDLPVLQNGQQLRRQGGDIRVRTGLGGGNHPHTGFFQEGPPLPRAAIGVDDIQIRQHYLFPLSGQRQGQIDGDLRLSGAVVAGEDRDAVGKHVLGRHKRFTSFFHKIVVLFFHLLYDVIVL